MIVLTSTCESLLLIVMSTCAPSLIALFCLQAVLGGNSSPSADDINKILGSGQPSHLLAAVCVASSLQTRAACLNTNSVMKPSMRVHHSHLMRCQVKTAGVAVGIEADSERVEALLKELEGKDITEVIASGVSKLASVPAGGGGVAAAGGMSHTLPKFCFQFAACSWHEPCRW